MKHDPDFPVDDENGEWHEVMELANRPGKPITFNWGGKQIIMPREAAKRAWQKLEDIFGFTGDPRDGAEIGRKGGEWADFAESVAEDALAARDDAMAERSAAGCDGIDPNADDAGDRETYEDERYEID